MSNWPKDTEVSAERMVQFFLGRADVLNGLASEAVLAEPRDHARTCELIEHMQGMWNSGYAIHFLIEGGHHNLAEELAQRLFDVAESGEYSEWTYDLLKLYPSAGDSE